MPDVRAREKIMTRGKLIYLLNKDGDCLVSQEFNGDMGDDMQCGQMALKKLNVCISAKQFLDVVRDFIKEFDYTDDWTPEQLESGDFVVKRNIVSRSFSNVNGEDYFENWFSDYLYIVNNTGEEVETLDHDGNPLIIGPGITVLCFGKKVEPDKQDPEPEPAEEEEPENESLFQILEEMRKSGMTYVVELEKRIEKSLGIVLGGIGD